MMMMIKPSLYKWLTIDSESEMSEHIRSGKENKTKSLTIINCNLRNRWGCRGGLGAEQPHSSKQMSTVRCDSQLSPGK